MKNFALILILAIVFLSACNDKPAKTEITNVQEPSNSTTVTNTNNTPANSVLDVKGTYKGIIPCASCSGIMTNLYLGENMKYTKKEYYLDSDTVIDSDGSFVIMDNGKTIQLSNGTEKENYRIENGSILMLNSEGKSSESGLQDMYRLKHIKGARIEFDDDPVLGELVFSNDVSSFIPCGTDVKYWIKDNNDRLKEMYSAVTENAAPETPVLAELIAEELDEQKDGLDESYEGTLQLTVLKSVKPFSSINNCFK